MDKEYQGADKIIRFDYKDSGIYAILEANNFYVGDVCFEELASLFCYILNTTYAGCSLNAFIDNLPQETIQQKSDLVGRYKYIM